MSPEELKIKTQTILCIKASFLADALIKALGEPMIPEYKKLVDEYIEAKENYSKALELEAMTGRIL